MSNIPDRKERLVTGRMPVMRETTYDHTSSVVIAAALVLIGSVILLIAIWLSNLLPSRPRTQTEMMPGISDTDDGIDNDSLEVEIPEDPSDDPSLSNDQQESKLEEVVEQTIIATSVVSQLKLPNNFSDESAGGNLASAAGSTGSPLGGGGSGIAIPAENRWIVEFSGSGSLSEYAQQLDFFGIELGVAFRDLRIVYVSNLSSTKDKRAKRVNSSEQRLFMSWQGGDRMKADLALLEEAGVADAVSGRILHFYPPETEAMLFQLEKNHANQPAEKIRSTRFRVTGESGAYQFIVTDQKYR
jgi:hypothetical protein